MYLSHVNFKILTRCVTLATVSSRNDTVSNSSGILLLKIINNKPIIFLIWCRANDLPTICQSVKLTVSCRNESPLYERGRSLH